MENLTEINEQSRVKHIELFANIKDVIDSELTDNLKIVKIESLIYQHHHKMKDIINYPAWGIPNH